MSDGVNSIASPEDQDNVEGQDNVEDQDNIEDQDNVEAQETTADQQESTADISTGRRYNLRRQLPTDYLCTRRPPF